MSDSPVGKKKKKKQEEVQDIETDEEDNASEENGSGSLGGGGDEADGQGGGDEQGGGKATPPEDPPTGTVTPQKRKVSPKKPSARKKMCASKPQLEAMLTEDDISLVHGAMEDASEDILQRYGVKKEELYGRVEKELKEVQQAIRLVRAVPTAFLITDCRIGG
jgi:hypothetical protein